VCVSVCVSRRCYPSSPAISHVRPAYPSCPPLLPLQPKPFAAAAHLPPRARHPPPLLPTPSPLALSRLHLRVERGCSRWRWMRRRLLRVRAEMRLVLRLLALRVQKHKY
jgi:hypothetical protein